MIDESNQPSPIIPPTKKPNIYLAALSGIFFVLLLITSIMLFTFRSNLKTAKNITPTPTVFSPSPTTIMKEEYSNPFAPTGAAKKQYNNPFEQTSNPFDELAK